MKFKTKIVAPSFIIESINNDSKPDFGKVAVNAYAKFSVVENAPEYITDFMHSTANFGFSEFHDAAVAFEKEDRKIAQLVRRFYLETGFFYPRDMFDYMHDAQIDNANSFVDVENGVAVIVSEKPIFRLVNALRRQHNGYPIDVQFKQQNKLHQTESESNI
jgi:hypothetical protein